MDRKWKYIGLFFSPEDAADLMTRYSRATLARPVDTLHVTARYQPEAVDTALFGREVTVEVTGYGNDGRNEGVSVALYTDDPALLPLIRGIAVPHVTLSIGETAQPVDTRYLDFAPVAGCRYTARFGGYDVRQGTVTQNP